MVTSNDFAVVIHVVDVTHEETAPEELLNQRNDCRETNKARCYPKHPQAIIGNCREWIEAASTPDMWIGNLLDANPEGDADYAEDTTGDEGLTRCGELRFPRLSRQAKSEHHDSNLGDVGERIQVSRKLALNNVQSDEQNHRGNQASTGLKQIHTG